jgi:hypothetical protein
MLTLRGVVDRILSPAAVVIYYVIGTVCVLCSAAYWYYTIPEEEGPVFLYTLYEHWSWFALGLGGLVLVGMPPLLYFLERYGVMTR